MNQQISALPERPDKADMASKRHASRAQRTRDLLLDGMYRLALEKDFREISVQELLSHTGVARSTFYAHFRDKEDLLVAGYECIGLPPTRVCNVAGEERVVLDVSAWLFNATERHAALTTSFFNSPSQAIILAHLENLLLIQVREHYRKHGIYECAGLRGEVAVRCFVGALIGSWLWWVRHDYPSPANEMTEAFDSLMNNGTWPAAN
ncbi:MULTISPECIES: TetR/AcrR family transcriptional regulator [Pseudomonadaceae]|uniref:TetR/AcrR family transcriptional regulator n=1 Tax=Pseudomonadaceae TaxID=135621 RepID=UPI00103B8352|nr:MULTISPECIES: TetR/AcrR family transcriptional regulator [Pseudomonadaceae]MBA1277989.1 helix-turn-helix transcriptional regulator [Stutzerimonas stutzeri]TCD23688.1 TetR/AcrR family transcriptional regulator [Pseudomonas sp. IC_126]